jgi:hypothetical protein
MNRLDDAGAAAKHFGGVTNARFTHQPLPPPPPPPPPLEPPPSLPEVEPGAEAAAAAAAAIDTPSALTKTAALDASKDRPEYHPGV